MAVDKTKDTLGHMGGSINTSWDWKKKYVGTLKGDGYERFSQLSATPDTTAIFGGPARFTGIAGKVDMLKPLGLIDGINYGMNPQVQQLYEIGSSRAFFTVGKTSGNLSFSSMLADSENILKVLADNARPDGLNLNEDGSGAAYGKNSNVMLNLDAEIARIPFGLLLVFKTRGGYGESLGGRGKVLSAVYLEYCMFTNYGFGVTSGAPVIQQGVGVVFDRPVPVNIT